MVFSQNLNADVCTPLIKSTKYILKENEKVSDVLQKFRLEPVFGEDGNLEKILKQNNLQDQDRIAAGTEISLPFNCEEDARGWKMIDRGSDRLIYLEKSKLKIGEVDSPSDVDKTATDIINKDIQNEKGTNLDGTGENTEVSEALRYRMICEGEWTGTECVTRYSTLFVLGGTWYNRYDGSDATTGADGVLLSKLNPEVGFGWTNYWTENFRTTLSFSILNNDIHPEVRERPIEQSKKIVNSINAEMKYEAGPWGFTIGMSQTEKLFYRFFQQNIFLNEDGGVVVNAVPILLFRGAVSYMLHQAGKYRFDLEAGYSILQGGKTSGYDVSPGSAQDVSITVQHDRVKEYIFGTFKYEKSHQDTDILIQNAQEIGLKFGYAWKLKDW
jgi:hypothetical protein